MRITPTETAPVKTDFSARQFKHVRSSLAYDDMHLIRDELTEFLQPCGIARTHAGNLLLALTEILSNLVKHPLRKADYIEIRLSVSGAHLDLEVLDNSTSFADFNAKCESALSRLQAAETGAESGYGLGIILAVHKRPQYTCQDLSADQLNHFRILYSAGALQSPETLPPQKIKNRIFLVDDDPISLQIHQRMLDGLYDVIAFSRAGDALGAFTHHQPDLIISDLTMPVMDGIALRKSLAEVDGGNTTPFIFLSGNTDNENNPYISHLGVDDYLCKPVTRERLHTVLARLLHRSQQLRSSVQGQFSHDITELLKPSLPENHGPWKFVTRHMVADAGGGDFILHHQTQTSMMGVLADVMGHGKQAKFFSCAYAGYLRSMFRMYAGTLDAVHFLKYLSQSIDGDPLLESMIMTCQCFQFLPEGIMKVASAGHPCPVILRPQGAEMIDVMGPLLGLAGDHAYDMKSVRFNPGDKILFMTDGFMEAFDRCGLAAQELLKQVSTAPAASAAGLADHLWQEFHKRLKKQLTNRDDATIIVAEYGEKA
jgi:serine/threonine-protein kinase RsbW